MADQRTLLAQKAEHSELAQLGGPVHETPRCWAAQERRMELLAEKKVEEKSIEESESHEEMNGNEAKSFKIFKCQRSSGETGEMS